MTVADVGTMIIKAGVNEVDIGKVRLEQPVKISLDAYPKVKFAGTSSASPPPRASRRRSRSSTWRSPSTARAPSCAPGMTANIDVVGREAREGADRARGGALPEGRQGGRLRQEAGGPQGGRLGGFLAKVFAAGKKDAPAAQARRQGQVEGEVRAARGRDRPRQRRQGPGREGPRGRRRGRGRGPDAAQGEEGP